MRKIAVGSLLALLMGVVLSPSQAMYMRPDLEKIPVARLIENIEKMIKEEPKNNRHKVNLARTHAMAYVMKTDEVEVNKRQPTVPWFGFEPKLVPFSTKLAETKDEEKLKVAKGHLDKAMELYTDAVKANPKDYVAQLGLAWLTEKSGKTDAAIKMYRELIKDAWDNKESQMQALGLGGHTITVEAGSYLIPLLDEEKDKAEIATLNERKKQIQRLPRPITPIVIPLADGLTVSDMEDRNAQVTFDVDGSNTGRTWSWITPKAAWLVYDAKHTGKIQSGLQLFGNVSFWMFWDNGYQAMSALDNNGDGQLTGEELAGLALWQDKNCNGVSDAGEVRSLKDHGIQALSCQHQPLANHSQKIAHSPKGVTFTNGKTRPTYDVILQSGQ